MFTELGELVVVTPKGSRYFEEVPLRLAPQVRRAARIGQRGGTVMIMAMPRGHRWW